MARPMKTGSAEEVFPSSRDPVTSADSALPSTWPVPKFAHPLPHQPGDAYEDPPPPCRDAGNADRGLALPRPPKTAAPTTIRRRLQAPAPAGACPSPCTKSRAEHRANPLPHPSAGKIAGARSPWTASPARPASRAARRPARKSRAGNMRQKGGGDCKVNLSYANQCGVIAWGNNRTSARFAATLEEASLALNECAQVSGGTCEVFFRLQHAGAHAIAEKPRHLRAAGCKTLLTQRQISVRIGLVRRRDSNPYTCYGVRT